MPIGVESFNCDRLIQARNARGLTNISLSELADVSTSSISLYEKGTQKPTQAALEKLSSALNVPIGFFFRDSCIDKPKRVFYRSMSAATKSARSRVEAQYEWVLEAIDYVMEFFDFPALNLPDIDVPNDFREIDSLQIESIANQLRSYWNLGQGPITNFVRTLESNGIVVWSTSLGAETLDAFSEFRRPHPLVVLGTDKDNYFRSRFDAAHELGHLIMHRKVDKTSISKSSDFKVLETQAHLFAGAFLLPATSYTRDLYSPSLDAFRALKPVWNVSIAAQIMRCRQLELIDEEQTKRLYINLSRRKWRVSEPLDDLVTPEKPNLIGKSFRMLLDNNVKSIEQLSSDLTLFTGDIEKISAVPFGSLRTISSPDTPILKSPSSNVLAFRRT